MHTFPHPTLPGPSAIRSPVPLEHNTGCVHAYSCSTACNRVYTTRYVWVTAIKQDAATVRARTTPRGVGQFQTDVTESDVFQCCSTGGATPATESREEQLVTDKYGIIHGCIAAAAAISTSSVYHRSSSSQLNAPVITVFEASSEFSENGLWTQLLEQSPEAFSADVRHPTTV